MVVMTNKISLIFIPLFFLVKVNSLCNECQTNYAACMDENHFAMCTGGNPESKIYSCPNGYVCTTKTSICLKKSETNLVDPSCEMTCGICNSPGKLFSCLSNTTYAFCFGKDFPDLNAKGICPVGYVCTLRSTEVCKKTTTDFPSCNAVLDENDSIITSPKIPGSLTTSIKPSYSKTSTTPKDESKMGEMITPIEVTSPKPTTTIELTSLKPTTIVEVTSLKTATTIEATTSKPTTTTVIDIPVTTPFESTTLKSELESSFCKEKQADGAYRLQNDPTCQKFIICYVLADQYLELIYTCAGSGYFNEGTKNCQTEKPLDCL